MKVTSVISERFTQLGASSSTFLVAELSPWCLTEEHNSKKKVLMKSGEKKEFYLVLK